MSKTQSINKSEFAFVFAYLDSIKMVKEESYHRQEEVFEQGSELDEVSVELEVKTSAKFEMGIDDTSNPKNIQIVLHYFVKGLIKGTEKEVANYISIHEAQFKVSKVHGIKDWKKSHEEAMSIYFSMVYNFAKSRAQNTLTALDLKEIPLGNIDFTKKSVE
jgi:hypothetical protein